MSEQELLSPIQALFLWRLVFDQGEGWAKDIKPELDARVRNDLAARGFIQVEKRKTGHKAAKANYVTLLDKGWRWGEEHLGGEITTKSPAVRFVLQLVLSQIRNHVTAGEFTLTQFCSGDDLPAARRELSPETESQLELVADRDNSPLEADLKRRVIAACQDLAEGAHSGRIRLADLRSQFDEIPRPQMDEVLRDLETSDAIVVYPLDNPRDITASDVEASLPNSSNSQRHIVYLKN